VRSVGSERSELKSRESYCKPTLCSERKKQERALRKGWAAVLSAKDGAPARDSLSLTAPSLLSRGTRQIGDVCVVVGHCA
jgi:hypothetical protein